MKAYQGRIGIYKGYKAEVHTTRCFLKLSKAAGSIPAGTTIRGVYLTLLENLDKEALTMMFMWHGRWWAAGESEPKTLVFVDIVDFRENFKYNDIMSTIYEK